MLLRSQDFSPGGISSGQQGAWRRLWVVLCLMVFGTHAAGMGLHTLEFQHWVQRGARTELRFFQTTLFEGEVVFYCESPTLVDQPRQKWTAETLSLNEHKNRRELCEGQYYEHMQWFEEIKRIGNGTAELLQRRRGCVVNGSGIFPFDQWGVNGEAFLTFEPSTQTWIAQTERAALVAAKWNKQDLRNQLRNHLYGHFGQTVCRTSYSWLKRKKQEWGEQAASIDMDIHVFATPIPERTVTYLKCQVTDSDLSGACIWLTKDGVRLGSGVELTGPLPNGDGTVQMRVQVKLSLTDTEAYQCHIQKDTHQTSATWDGKTLDGKFVSSSQPLDRGRWKTTDGLLLCIVALVAIIVNTTMRLKRRRRREEQCMSTIEQQIRLYLQLVLSDEDYEKWTKIADNFYGKYESVFRKGCNYGQHS